MRDTDSEKRFFKGEPNQQLLMTVRHVAAMCDVSLKTVSRWIDSEGLPVHRLPGRGGHTIRLVSRDDLDSWLARFRHDPTDADDADGSVIRLDGRRFFEADDRPRDKGPQDQPRRRA